jgi:pimeloyl-ACP methyl ester carboxylesterase
MNATQAGATPVGAIRESPPQFVERFVDAGGERVRVLQAGQGQPLLVLAEAGAAPAIADELLAQTNHVIFAFVPGAPRQAAGTLAAALAALGFDQVAVLASSLTAPAALWLAIECPARVRALVLESPLAFAPHLPTVAGRSADEWQTAFNIHSDRKRAATTPDAATFAQRAKTRIDGAQDQAFTQKLAAFDAPVLTLFGTRDKLAPVELGRFYKTLFPSAWFLMVYDAAHDISGDRPEAFAEAVGDFLQRGAQFAISDRSTRLNR